MKKINLFNFWLSGKTLTAAYLYINCAGDNLKDSAVIYWAFYDESDGNPGNKLTEGNLTLNGEDYNSYTNNEFVWNWVSSQLGVTFEQTENSEPKVSKKK